MSIPISDGYGILLRLVDEYLDKEMDLDLCGDPANKCDSEERDLDKDIYFMRNLIYTIKDIKEISEENLKKKE